MSAMARPARGAGARDQSVEEAATSGDLLYLYCVLEPGSSADLLLRTGGLTGIDEHGPLFAIEAGGLIAAVSHVPRALFAEEPLNELVAELPRLAPHALRHEEAIRALFGAASALVPLSFGAIYQDEASVAAFLTSERARLRSLLDTLREKEEWGVKVFVDAPVAASAAEASSAALAALDAEVSMAAPGRAYLLHRKREGMLADEVRQFVLRTLERVIDELVPASVDARMEEAPPNQQGTTELVLKAAFLVERSRSEGFRDRAAALVDTLASVGLTMEVTGPWAPYSFTGDRP